jgi:hypothetical protein
MTTTTAKVLRMPESVSAGASIIGTDVTTGQEVCISQQAQQQGLIHLVGVSGSGKTTALHNLIHQALLAGRGLALVEPHGDLTKAVLATMPEKRVADVVVLNLMDCGEEPSGLNIFARPTPYTVTEVAKTASQVFHIFAKAWGIGPQTPQLAMVLRHVTRTLIDCRATFSEIPLLLQDEAVREAMVKRVTNPHTRLFWEAYERKSARDKAEFTASTLNKVDAYLQEGIANILSQERSTIDFRRIMDEGKVLLVLLSPQLEEMSRLIGSMVVAGLLRAAFSRADTPEDHRRPFSLYIDEFQTFLTEDTAVLIHESRKWHLSPVVLSNQSLAQLDEANRAAVAGASTRIVFRVSAEDAKALAPGFDTTPTREIVGEEPVRAPVSDVVGHLVRRGHTNSSVVGPFVTDYLMSLEVLLKKVGVYQHEFAFGCTIIRAAHLIEGQRLVNDCLAACMRTGRSDGFIPPLALLTLGGSADERSTYVLYKHVRSSVFEGYVVEGFYQSANRFGRAGFLADEQKALEILKQEAKTSVWDRLTPSTIVERASAFLRMLRSLRTVMDILAKEPILVDTGQYQPKYQTRTYADMVGQIVNELSSKLPNFHAKVKLLSGEHVIRTNPAPKGLSGDLFAARLARIKRQMRLLGYVRDVRDVEEEVRKRHEKLRGSAGADDPPPTRF